LKSGTGQPFVLFKQSFARPLRLPAMQEQAAIADVLSDMDAELAALERFPIILRHSPQRRSSWYTLRV